MSKVFILCAADPYEDSDLIAVDSGPGAEARLEAEGKRLEAKMVAESLAAKIREVKSDLGDDAANTPERVIERLAIAEYGQPTCSRSYWVTDVPRLAPPKSREGQRVDDYYASTHGI